MFQVTAHPLHSLHWTSDTCNGATSSYTSVSCMRIDVSVKIKVFPRQPEITFNRDIELHDALLLREFMAGIMAGNTTGHGHYGCTLREKHTGKRPSAQLYNRAATPYKQTCQCLRQNRKRLRVRRFRLLGVHEVFQSVVDIWTVVFRGGRHARSYSQKIWSLLRTSNREAMKHRPIDLRKFSYSLPVEKEQ